MRLVIAGATLTLALTSSRWAHAQDPAAQPSGSGSPPTAPTTTTTTTTRTTPEHEHEQPAPAVTNEPPLGNVDSSSGTGSPPGGVPSQAVETKTIGEPVTDPKALRFTGTLGVISLPRLLSLELLARFRKKSDPDWDLFAVGAGIEYLPPGLASFGEFTTLSWLSVGPEARFFAWRFLFAGLRLGYQFSRADSENFGSEVDYVTTSFFVAPKIGALYTLKSGLTLGADLGATIPLLPSTTRDSDGTTDSNARKVAKTFGMFVMPFLSLRVGWTI